MVNPLRHSFARALALAACLIAFVPGGALAAPAGDGGASMQDPKYRPAKKAKIVNGYAIAPKSAPRRVKMAIAAANEIVDKPYRYGGGHASVKDSGYDCSGTISYALIGAKLLKSPLDSTGFMSWGKRGKGKWISVYAHRGHAFVMIAGLRLDTGYRDPNGARYGQKPGSGPRWNKAGRGKGPYVVRHPAGY